MAEEERGSCINIFRMTNCGQISETFTNYEAKDLLRKSKDHVLTYSRRKIVVGSQKPSRITRQKTCCSSESNTSVRVVFANQSGFDAPIGVVLAWEERGSCHNIFRTTNRGRISETFTNYEAKDLLRKSVDHVLTYSGRKIKVGSQKPSRITRQKTCCASESNTSVRVVFANRSGFDAPIGFFLAWEERGPCLNIFRTKNRDQISEMFMNYEAKELFRKEKTCCANESNMPVRVAFANRSRFDAPIAVVMEWEERGSCVNIFRTKNRGRISETFTNYEAKDLFPRSVDHVLTYSGRQITVRSQKSSRITRQNTCCASESNTSVRVVFANWSGFDAPIGIFLAWEERGSCLNIFWTTNHDRISETFTNYKVKHLFRNRHGMGGVWIMSSHIPDDKSRSDLTNLHELRGKILVAQSTWHRRSVDHVLTYSGRQITVRSQKPSRITMQKTCCASESNTSVRVVFASRSGFDAPIAVVLAWEEQGSCPNIFQKKNRGRISKRFTNYEAKDLLRKSVDHVLTYSGRQIAVGSQKASQITRQKTCCASESNTSVRVVFASRSGFHAPIGVVLAWEERGSCLNIFRTTNRGRILETLSNYEAKHLLRKHGRSVDLFLTYFERQIAIESQKPSRITRQKTCCASESNKLVLVVFANRSGFDAPIGVVLAWEERGSCLNIFQTKNHGQISKTFTNCEAKDLLRKQKTSCAGESNTSVGVVFANRSGFDAPIGVVFALEGRGSCLNIFQMTIRGRISENFTNSEAKDLSVNHLLTYSGRQIAVGSQKTSRITRQKTCCACKSNTSVRVVFENRSGFDAPIGVVLPWEQRGSCLNIFWTTNRGRNSETFMNYEAKDLFRKSVDHFLTSSGRKIEVGSQKFSRIMRQKTCCASESNTSVRVVFANRSGFDVPIGVIMAWQERGSCVNIFRTTKRGRISETFTNYEAKDLLHKSMDHVLTYSGQKIEVGSQKSSRITRQKTCCAGESNTSVRVVLANRSAFDAPIGVVLAWEDRGSCLNIFRMTNRDWVYETFTNYEAKDLLRKTKNRGRISETFTNYEAKDLLRKNLHVLRGERLVAQVSQTRRFALYLRTVVVLMLQLLSSWHGRTMDHVLTHFGRQIMVGSQKTSRITRQKTCCASESNTSVRVVFANRSGFDAPTVLAREERGSCLNIFRMPNPDQISETFTNYEAKDLLRKSADNVLIYSGRQIGIGSQKPSRSTSKRLVAQSSSHWRSLDLVLTYSGRQITVGSQRPSRITRQKTCCANESNTSVRVVFANRSGFDALIGIFHGMGGAESDTPVRVVFTNQNGFDAPIGVVLAWEERVSCLNIFRTTNRGRISETYTNYEAKDLLRKNLHELQGKRLVAQVSQTRRFALYLRTGVVLKLQLESSRYGRSMDDEEHDTKSTQGWKTNILKDPLQGIGGPMTRARTKAMKEALNCFIRDLTELELNYIKESTINMSSKSPRNVVTMLKAQQDDVQGLCGVHMEELT
ncbi:hypothetical protein G2W53_041922 [Senna tora]|uniref:Uncharacterized protein n=1 Tax=Senna tora TaxID=362788 RepID=A0A834SGH4_9FABA|nr:hypothetical protein G2W53_041922 [Senna tora]